MSPYFSMSLLLCVAYLMSCMGSPIIGQPFDVTHKAVVAPSPFPAASCGSTPAQGAALSGTFYFLPTAGTKNPALVTYTPTSGSWGSITIPESSGVLSMLNGASMTPVKAMNKGTDDFIVISGGGSNHVVAYNVQTKAWKAMKGLSNHNSDACSTGCEGYGS